MMNKTKKLYNIKTEKRNKIVVEEINPNEMREIWDKLSDLNQTL